LEGVKIASHAPLLSVLRLCGRGRLEKLGPKEGPNELLTCEKMREPRKMNSQKKRKNRTREGKGPTLDRQVEHNVAF